MFWAFVDANISIRDVKQDTNPRARNINKFIVQLFLLGMVSKQREEQKHTAGAGLRTHRGRPELLVSCEFI